MKHPVSLTPLPPTARLAAFALGAALSLAAPPARAAQTISFVYTVPGYDSPTIVNSNGTYFFYVTGITPANAVSSEPLTLSVGQSQTILLDNTGLFSYDGGYARNSDTPAVYHGSAATSLDVAVVGGSDLGTQSVTQDYTYDVTQRSQTPPPDWLAADPLAFDVGNGDTLTITPIATTYLRKATATLSGPAASAAPEPSQVGMLALMGVGLTGLLVRARRKPAA